MFSWLNMLLVWQNVEFEYTNRYDALFLTIQQSINTAYLLR